MYYHLAQEVQQNGEKEGAIAGAYGCTISGAGPTCVAVTDNPQKGERIAEAMVQAFVSSGKLAVNSARVVRLDQTGAKTC